MSISDLYKKYLGSAGISTDTRVINKDQMFFALKGDNFNANSFASQALEMGAAFVIIDEAQYQTSDQTILVPDVLTCLQELAKYHRKQLNTRIIGLTGSNGKTTNKELLALVLGSKFKVHATKGNLNNHIGVPLTLLNMPADTEFGIIEMGANHQKEIELLSGISEPDFGFITNIGKAHLEGFGGPEGVKKGKGELFDYLKENGKIAFVNENDLIVSELAKEKKLNTVVYFGADENALKLISESPQIVFETPDLLKFTCHISGKYNFDNMQTAYAIGRYFGVDSLAAAQALASYNPDNNRSQILEKGSNSFIMDAYNANPSSMQVSVANFANLATTKSKIVILGDMFELGEFTQSEHENLGMQVAEANFQTVVLYGEHMKHALKYLPKAYYFTDKFSLHNWLIDKNFQDSFFLIKGSRGVKLETVLEVM